MESPKGKEDEFFEFIMNNPKVDTKKSYYSFFNLNEHILKEKAKIQYFQGLIRDNLHCFLDKVVMNVNPGFGLFAMYCAFVGAKKVYVLARNPCQ